MSSDGFAARLAAVPEEKSVEIDLAMIEEAKKINDETGAPLEVSNHEKTQSELQTL